MNSFNSWVENISIVVKLLYGVSAIASIIYWYKYKDTALRYFPILLVLTFFLEFYGEWLYVTLGYNALFYNLYNSLFFLFFYHVFRSFIKNRNFKKWILYSAILFLAATFIDPFFESFIDFPQLLSYIVGGCVLIFCIILYYIEILTTSKILVIKHDILFWISVGLLLFYVGYLPIKFTRTFFASSQDLFMTLRLVHWILIFIMHSCFIIGFVWTKKRLPD